MAGGLFSCPPPPAPFRLLPFICPFRLPLSSAPFLLTPFSCLFSLHTRNEPPLWPAPLARPHPTQPLHFVPPWSPSPHILLTHTPHPTFSSPHAPHPTCPSPHAPRHLPLATCPSPHAPYHPKGTLCRMAYRLRKSKTNFRGQCRFTALTCSQLSPCLQLARVHSSHVFTALQRAYP